MKIRSVRLLRLKRFHDWVRVDFNDPVRKKIRDRTVLVGKNGSGKTTILEAIYSALELMGSGREAVQKSKADIFSPASMEISLEIPWGDNDGCIIRTGDYTPFVQSEATEHFYMDRMQEDKPPTIDMLIDEGFSVRNKNALSLLHSIRTAVAGIDDSPKIGNILYFPTDRITHFVDSRRQGDLVNEQPQFKWAYKYNRNHETWEGSLESYLCWLYFRDLKVKESKPDEPSRFDEFKSIVNRFLEGKQITTVTINYRVEVKDTETGKSFGLNALSSGEKQIVLLIGELFRNIQIGSVVLIDEPEIHLHPVWQKILISTLTALCKKYEAQLIVTTQSPRIAESFLEHEVIELDDLLEESNS